jgi:hypothetical protein
MERPGGIWKQTADDADERGYGRTTGGAARDWHRLLQIDVSYLSAAIRVIRGPLLGSMTDSPVGCKLAAEWDRPMDGALRLFKESLTSLRSLVLRSVLYDQRVASKGIARLQRAMPSLRVSMHGRR